MVNLKMKIVLLESNNKLKQTVFNFFDRIRQILKTLDKVYYFKNHVSFFNNTSDCHQVLPVRVHSVHNHRDGRRAALRAAYYSAVSKPDKLKYERTNFTVIIIIYLYTIIL